MLVEIKSELCYFIAEKMPTLVGKITTMYPDGSRFSPPSCVVDIVFNEGRSTVNNVMIEEALARISFISNSPLEVDQLVDSFKKYIIKESNKDLNFTYARIRKIESVSPIVPAFYEKDGFWRRDVDVSLFWVNDDGEFLNTIIYDGGDA